MKLTLPEPKYLKDSVSVISELVSEIRFKVTSTGLFAVAVDPANVAMVVFKLLSSSFSEFVVNEDIELGINLNNLKQILRRVEASEIVTLETDADNSKLKITVKGQVVRKFAIPIIELDEKEKKEPSLEFAAEITMPARVLSSAIEDADVVADSVALVCDTNKLRVVAEGDLNNVEVEISESEDIKIKNYDEATVRAKYSLEYLKKMMQGSKLSEVITISFSNNYPIKVSYLVVDKLSLSFILAPRVEGD